MSAPQSSPHSLEQSLQPSAVPRFVHLRLHSEFSVVDGGIDAAQAVDDRELGVQAQVDETRYR